MHVRKLFKDSKLKDLSYVMLVGGFGTSYILQEAIYKVIPIQFKLIVPPEAQLTVLKGAVYFGFNLHEITSRIARMTYGTDIGEYFIPGKHDERHKVTRDRGDCCDEIFEPFILKGDAAEYGKTIDKVREPVSEKQTTALIDIYCTDLTDFSEVHYVDEPGMHHVGQLELNMPNVGRYSNTTIKLQFWFGGTEIKVTVIDKSSGETAEVNIDFTSHRK
jgi:hypothetical protein